MKLIHHRAFSSVEARSAGRCARTLGSAARFPSSHTTSWHSLPSPLHEPKIVSQTRLRPALATPSTSAPAGGQQPSAQPIVVPLPESQQAAIADAVQCLVPLLQPLLAAAKPAKTAKGFSGARNGNSGATNRFGIEIPVQDTSPQAVLDLTTAVVTQTAAKLKQRGGGSGGAPAWTVVHARDDVVQLIRTRGSGVGQVLGLRQACQQPQLAGVLLLVEPSVSDVALVEQLLDEVWVGTAAVVLNPQWAQHGVTVPAEYGRVVEGITVLYSFLPCAIQGLLGKKEGAVLRAVQPGLPAAATAWRILLQQKDEFVQVGAMSRRPTSSDLELAFLNASAAASPLTKTAKFIRGLIPGGAGDGKKK